MVGALKDSESLALDQDLPGDHRPQKLLQWGKLFLILDILKRLILDMSEWFHLVITLGR